ncbi:hypothetical protein AX279_17715 [Pseudomonas sp. J237]|nr:MULTISPECIES: hypothetical protein [Pseudomonas]OEO24506.1 hypothetical protein AX279_17715 [Pseudomonas sp. J237]CRN68984.1 hypothetical protein PAERUG_P40_Scotland_4_VIM_2_09_12_04171 [Pseudomonas aeruginosa]
MNWLVYEILPVDFGWEHLRTVQQTLADITSAPETISDESQKLDLSEALQFSAKWEAAKTAAREHGWEGDFRHDPRVFWLPGETKFDLAFVFKQDNNGTTYVVSPVVLPWLDALT